MMSFLFVFLAFMPEVSLVFFTGSSSLPLSQGTLGLSAHPSSVYVHCLGNPSDISLSHVVLYATSILVSASVDSQP